MRIDKFLWCLRFFKTRSLATTACKKGWVRINGSVVKPAKDVIPGDEILFRKNQINYTFQVLNIPESRLGAKLIQLYIKDLTAVEELERIEAIRSSKEYYRKKGIGRPTKKDRRDLDGYFNEEE